MKKETYAWSTSEGYSSESDDQNLKNKDAHQNREVEGRSEKARKNEELIVQLSSVELIEECHHHEYVEAVGVVDRRRIAKIVVSSDFKTGSNQTS